MLGNTKSQELTDHSLPLTVEFAHLPLVLWLLSERHLGDLEAVAAPFELTPTLTSGTHVLASFL